MCSEGSDLSSHKHGSEHTRGGSDGLAKNSQRGEGRQSATRGGANVYT
jgi:hypothetical protein